jgi:hypothetical protein
MNTNPDQQRSITAGSQIDALIDELETDRARLKAAVNRVPPTIRGQRPAPDRWSVAEILEHLAIVEQRAATIVKELAVSAPARGPGSSADTPPTFDRSVLRDRTRRATAPVPIQPKGQWDAEHAWAELEKSRVALLAAIRAAEGRDLTAVTRSHPRLGPLTGYEWIAALGAHEERHALQIGEIADRST